MTSEPLEIDGHYFEGIHVRTAKANILLIKADDGFLGCGYFNLESAERLGEPVAIVRGVKSFSDMLEAKVVGRSTTAGQLGIEPGMTGREALLKLPSARKGA